MTSARGIRNRNPGNIVVSGWTVRQTGYVGPEPEGRFARFDTMSHGVQALLSLLMNYRRQGLITVRQIINRWAPPVENDTGSYVMSVAKAIGVGIDEELPAEADTYIRLARAIVAHENGRSEATAVTDQDYADAAAAVFGATSQAPITSSEGGRAAEPAPAPISQAPAGPPPVGPSPPPAGAVPAPTQETRMPLPIAATVALAAELWKILRPTPKVEAAAGAIEKAAPVLFDAARTAVPTAVNEQQMVERIKSDPQVQAQFRVAAMARWDELSPAWEAEEKSRREAREFGAEMTGTGPIWRQIGAGMLIGVLSLTIILGGGVLFWQMLESPQLDPGQKGLVLGALLAAFTSAVGYWFGSSASGRLKDQTIADQARR